MTIPGCNAGIGGSFGGTGHVRDIQIGELLGMRGKEDGNRFTDPDRSATVAPDGFEASDVSVTLLPESPCARNALRSCSRDKRTVGIIIPTVRKAKAKEARKRGKTLV
jgi:hypothetical protein